VKAEGAGATAEEDAGAGAEGVVQKA